MLRRSQEAKETQKKTSCHEKERWKTELFPLSYRSFIVLFAAEAHSYRTGCVSGEGKTVPLGYPVIFIPARIETGHGAVLPLPLPRQIVHGAQQVDVAFEAAGEVDPVDLSLIHI